MGVFAGFDDPRSRGKRETGSSVAVPIFKEFMQNALKGTAPIPFRQPEGIRNVKINADTGARARPGDERTIWESFLIGTEPTDQIYILDGNGVNPMPQGGLVNGDEYINFNGQTINGDEGFIRYENPSRNNNSATTGTGGLY